MQKTLNILIISLLLFTACGKDPWEDYEPPGSSVEDEMPVDEEPIEEDPAGEEGDETAPEEEEGGEDEDEPGEEGNTITLSVMSFGIFNQRADLNQVAALINEYEPDLVVLREIDRNNTRTGIDIDQGQEVANLTEMNYYFASGWSYREGEYGPSLLSRYEITESQSQVLSVGSEYGGQERPFGWVTLQVAEDLDVVFATAHLDDGSNADRRAENLPIQAREIVEIFSTESNPIILGGNFYFQTQQDAHLDILYNMFTPGCTDCALTYPADNPAFVADHIMYKGNETTEMEIVSYTVGEEVLNNRKPVFAEIKISW